MVSVVSVCRGPPRANSSCRVGERSVACVRGCWVAGGGPVQDRLACAEPGVVYARLADQLGVTTIRFHNVRRRFAESRLEVGRPAVAGAAEDRSGVDRGRAGQLERWARRSSSTQVFGNPPKRRDLRFVDPVVGPASLSSAERRARSRGQGWAHGLNLHFQSCGACTMPLPTSAGLNPGFKLAVIAEPTSRSVNRCCEK